MAGHGQDELEPWKKALLSRDFDLVHTQLLLLDGDVTPSERAQLVQEIFTAVKQIEELTSTKFNSDDPPGTSVKMENYGGPYRKEGKDEKQMHQSCFIQCQVCGANATVSLKCRYDWFCNGCRLFKRRLEKYLREGKKLPSCNHKGKKILGHCRGCRRFKLEEFWLKNRQHRVPYSLPLMADDIRRNEAGSSSSDAQDSSSEGKRNDPEDENDSDFDWSPNA